MALRVAPAVGLLAALAVGGCATGKKQVEPPTKVAPAAAEARVADLLGADRSLVSVRLKETTPPELWRSVRVQTFEVQGDLYAGESFAVTTQDAAQLGSGYGGPGVTFTLVEDLDGDGLADLGYVTGGGTGVTRYTVGVVDRPGYTMLADGTLDPAAPRSPLRRRGVDFEYRDPVVLRLNGGRLEVRDPARQVLLGVIRLAASSATFEPNRDLPPFVRRRFVRPTL